MKYKKLYRVKRELIDEQIIKMFPNINNWLFPKDWYIKNNILKEEDIEEVVSFRVKFKTGKLEKALKKLNEEINKLNNK